MRLASVQECREIDERSQSERGIEGDTLMERAGQASADLILSRFKNRFDSGKTVAIVCGGGGNGGDGLVVARKLTEVQVNTFVYLTDPESQHELFQLNLDRLRQTPHVRIETLTDKNLIEISKADVVVDALFGIGLTREPKGIHRSAIEVMNSSAGVRVSLDVPSGLDADKGIPLGIAVEAHVTVSFGIAKQGFAVNEGPSHIGELVVVDIGFPIDLVKQIAHTRLGFDRRLARKFLPKRKSSGNKTTFGRVTVLAGSKGMGGAAVLCGTAASRIGAGYVTVATDGKPQEILNEAPEFLTANLSDEKVFANLEDTSKRSSKARFASASSAPQSSVVVGPGLGSKAGDVLEKLRSTQNPVVVDADALTALSKKPRTLPKTWILTPHAGELSRLLGVEAKEIERDRFRYAEEAAKKFGCIVLLKGFRTIVSNGERSVVVLSGNAALAKAGMGDVLAGMIAGLLAQGLKPFAAACLGAYVHGFLADEWLKSGRDILSFQPSDLSSSLPFVLRGLR